MARFRRIFVRSIMCCGFTFIQGGATAVFGATCAGGLQEGARVGWHTKRGDDARLAASVCDTSVAGRDRFTIHTVVFFYSWEVTIFEMGQILRTVRICTATGLHAAVNQFPLTTHRVVFPWVLMLIRLLPLDGLLVTSASADGITTRSGTTNIGTIVNISDQAIALRIGRETAVFLRASVTEIAFDKSDQVVLSSGDTLIGKVLRRESDGFLLAGEQELKLVHASSVIEILYSAGGPIHLREITNTDAIFRFEELPVETAKSRVFFCAYLGVQNLTYSFPGVPPISPLPFEKSISGQPYGVEAGIEISSRVTATIGVCWCDAQTGLTVTEGVLPPRSIGYTTFFVSGMYNLFPENRLDVFVRVQLGIQRAGYTLYTSDARPTSSGIGMLVPGIGAQYTLSAYVHVFCRLDWYRAKLGLNYVGDTVSTEGPAIFAGLRVYVPKTVF